MQRLVVAALLLVLVGGCSSDPEPKEPKPSAKPTITAPTMPAQAKENTPEGASAFVGYYVKALNYASNTGDVADLVQLSSDSCAGCASYIDLYRAVYKDGGFFKDSDWKLGDLDVTMGEGQAVVFGTVTSPPGTYAKDSHSSPKPGESENSDLTFIVKRSGAGWTLETLELQAAS